MGIIARGKISHSVCKGSYMRETSPWNIDATNLTILSLSPFKQYLCVHRYIHKKPLQQYNLCRCQDMWCRVKVDFSFPSESICIAVYEHLSVYWNCIKVMLIKALQNYKQNIHCTNRKATLVYWLTLQK